MLPGTSTSVHWCVNSLPSCTIVTSSVFAAAVWTIVTSIGFAKRMFTGEISTLKLMPCDLCPMPILFWVSPV